MRICIKCGKEKHDDEFSWKIKKQSIRQPICRDCANAYAAAYRLENRTEVIENLRTYYNANRDKLLNQKKEYYAVKGEELKTKRKVYVANNREKVLAAVTARNQHLKMQAFLVYGGPHCICCGETEVCFLSLDHINNDGAAQRKISGSGSRFYNWLKANKYPPGLRVMCFNCNLGRHVNGGICPHEKITPHFIGLAQACPEGADETSVAVTARSR